MVMFYWLSLTCLILCCTSALASSYITIQSAFSNNTIRYKTWETEEAWPCDSGSRHHTGWADIKDRHLFFWFHEARHGKQDAPLLIWFQGGPGGSSLHGSFVENGPCLVENATSTFFNPHSWTEEFNVVYLDQPAGVGFSYVDDVKNEESYHNRSETSSLDVVTFIRLLYEAFPQLAKVDLYLSGESYAGRYVPVIADTILSYNDLLGGSLDTAIPLRSLIIGNPWIEPVVQMPSLYDVSCHTYRGTYPPFMNATLCEQALRLSDRCEALLHACATAIVKGGDTVLCSGATTLCFDNYYKVFMNATSGIYDRRLTDCPDAGSCYDDMLQTIEFLGSRSVLHDRLEVDIRSDGRKRTWDMISEVIERRYISSGDYFIPASPHVQRILNYARDRRLNNALRPLDVLIYAGVADVACNADGVHTLLKNLRWEGRREFHGAPWQELPWNLSDGGKPAGRIKGVSNLWMAEMNDAGHMVPYDQPASMSRLLTLWLGQISNNKARDKIEEAKELRNWRIPVDQVQKLLRHN